jgi:hypothetical protein
VLRRHVYGLNVVCWCDRPVATVALYMYGLRL